MTKPYQICTRCVMDTSDPDITFDASGVCSHCHEFEAKGRPILEHAASEAGRRELAALVERIKADGKGREYDCILGVSGGVDSTYAACVAKELGLRPLAVHFDSGWNSELAVNNIENIVKILGIDLHTFVCDWDEMRDLQLAFFKASLANCDIPQDHAFTATLYHEAAKFNIKYIISGGNAATEFILPTAWGYNALDITHLAAVHSRFGTMPLRHYPKLSFFKRYFYYPFIAGIKTVRLLDTLPYNKAEAKKYITKEVSWRDYGGKHYESIFTRFFQAYYLPTKFGYDKRRAHLSSLIVSGQIERDEALEQLRQPPCEPDMLMRDKGYVAKKIGISVCEFDRLIGLPPRTYREFPSSEKLFHFKNWLVAKIRKIPVLHNVRR